jgi:threonine-phosphate decarboxylase
MTKMYAIAGLRLGYGICSDLEIIKKIRLSGQPWSVNTIASQAGITALKDYEYRKIFIDFIVQEREFLYMQMKKLGFEVWKPNANYIFFKADKFENLDEKLLDYNIMIRHCNNYIGLSNEYYRICVRSREENIHLLDCIEKIIREKD